MPVCVKGHLRRMDDEEFKERAYEVMNHAFEMQEAFGRLFHETVYQQELACRVAGSRREVPVEVRFDDFCKIYYLDLLVRDGALFELKTVSRLAERHRSQLLQYLFLTELPHGKLINLRTERVQHEFVNNTTSRQDRTAFDICADDWRQANHRPLMKPMIAVLRDWGTGLDIALY